MRLLSSLQRRLSVLRHGFRRFLAREPKTGPPELELRFLEERILYSGTPLVPELLAPDSDAMDGPNGSSYHDESFATVQSADLARSLEGDKDPEIQDTKISTDVNLEDLDSLITQLAALESLRECSETISAPQDSVASSTETDTQLHALWVTTDEGARLGANQEFDSERRSADARHELIVVDQSLLDATSIESAWRIDHNDSRAFTVLVMDRTVDGVELLGDFLAESNNAYHAIHLVTHGISGAFELGNVLLSTENLDQYTGPLGKWRTALTDDADLLLYGCSIAHGAYGEGFVDQLADLLKRDIAASTNLTGTASRGGDWVLEYSKGQVGTRSLFGDTIEDWQFVLSANNAPMLNPSANPSLGTVLEGATNPNGITVASMIVDGSVTDPDGSPLEAIAIIGLNTSMGSWQYSLDDGATWSTIDANGINSQTNELALLLSPTSQLRLLPFGDQNGLLSDAIAFRAWDQTMGSPGQYIDISGTGGISALSDASDSASILVAGVNDTPTFFRGDGVVTTGFGTGNSICYGMAVQPDGKVILIGYSVVGGTEDFALVRYNLDGSLDSSFGNGTGKVTASIRAGVEWGFSVLVQPDGKIVVGGTVGGSNDDFALLRFNSDGSLDNSFGVNGKISTAIGTSTDQAYSVAVQSDGKLVIGGFASIHGTQDFALARYNIDGSLDTSFGSGGKITTAIGSSDEQAFSLAIQSDGKILNGGVARIGGNEDFALVRYNNDGTLDASFGTGGRVTTGFGSGSDRGWSVVVQSDGKILVGGSATVDSKLDFALARYLADGSLDTSFGVGGRVITSICSDNDAGRSITVQSDGRILVAGYARDNGLNEFAIARYNIDGSLDSSFGVGGRVITSVGPGNDYGLNVRVQPDGKILIGGFASAGVPNNFALVRLNGDGSLDGSFDLMDTLGNTVDYRLQGAPVVLDPNVSVFDAELTLGDFRGSTLTLVRNGGANSQDLFSGTGTLGALIQGNAFVVDGVSIGTVTTNSGGILTLDFNANANSSLVNSAMWQIAFENPNGIPFTQVSILWVFSDGNAGLQGSGGPLTATGIVTVKIAEPNQAPFAVADTATAMEAGGLNNGTAGIDPAGNVLTNDTDADMGDTKTVTGIAAGVLTSAAGNVAIPISGSFGSITIAANGAFRYNLDNSNASVQALRTPANTLTDIFTYTMRDAGGLTSTSQITVTIQGENDTPDDLSGSFTVAENAANGMFAGVVVSSDFDSGDGAIYSLVDSAGGRFAIQSTSGVITVSNSSLLDREVAAGHNITIRVTDSAGSTYNEIFSVILTDIDEFVVGPITDADVAINRVPENAANGTAVGITAIASDADATNNTITYSLDDSAGGRFAIDSSTGVVTIANSSLLNFEAMASHKITVRATSSDGSFSTAIFTLGLTDIDEFDVGLIIDANIAANSVFENAANGTLLGITATASDADATNNTIVYSLDDSAGGRFAINSFTGVVSVADGSLLDFERSVSHSISIRAISSDGSSSFTSMTIVILPQNERPIALGEQYQTDYVSPIAIFVSQVLQNDFDPDGDPMQIVFLAMPSQGEWSVTQNGTLFYRPEINQVGAVQIVYSVSDGLLLSDARAIEIWIMPPTSLVVVPPDDLRSPIATDCEISIAKEARQESEPVESSETMAPLSEPASRSYGLTCSTGDHSFAMEVSDDMESLLEERGIPLNDFSVQERCWYISGSDSHLLSERKIAIDPRSDRIQAPKQILLDRFGSQVERISMISRDQESLPHAQPTMGFGRAISAGVSLHILVGAQMGSAILAQAGMVVPMDTMVMETYWKAKGAKNSLATGMKDNRISVEN